MSGDFEPRVVMTTPLGRWKWWPALELVDFTPRGRRNPTETVHLGRSEHSIEGTLRAIARHTLRSAGK